MAENMSREAKDQLHGRSKIRKRQGRQGVPESQGSQDITEKGKSNQSTGSSEQRGENAID